MRGWPLARALLAFICLALLGLPLRKLTAPPLSGGSERKVAAARVLVPEKVTIVLIFSQPPETFALTYLGKEVIQENNPVMFDFTQSLEVAYPPEGIDFVLRAKWAERFRKVGASVQVIRADGSSHTKTLWGNGQFNEVLTFPARFSPI